MSNLLKTITSSVNPSSVDDMKAKISNHGGLAPSNRFGLIMTPPTNAVLSYSSIIEDAVRGNLTLGSIMQNSNDLSFFVESCQFPGKQINSLDNVLHRNSLKYPNGYVYEDITVNFLLPTDYFIKNLFDAWQNMVIDKNTYRAGYKDDYTSDIIISQLDKRNYPVYTIKLKNAWPVGVNSIDLDNTAESAFSRLSVAFTFEEIEDGNALTTLVGQAKGFVSSIPQIPEIRLPSFGF
jgi:hypothetical protein